MQKGDKMARYTTRDEAIHREIIEPIEAGDATAAEYNIDAIADAVLLDYDNGYAPDPEVDFWAVVEKHGKTFSPHR